MTTDQQAAGHAQADYLEAVKLGIWLESVVRPTLKRWRGSADDRVKLLATVLSQMIDGHYANGDITLLAELYELWGRQEAATAEAARNTAARAAETGQE